MQNFSTVVQVVVWFSAFWVVVNRKFICKVRVATDELDAGNGALFWMLADFQLLLFTSISLHCLGNSC